MGFLSSLDSRRPSNATYQQNSGWLADLLRGGVNSDSGITVNERSAMRVSTVYKCVQWRANQFGMLPKKVMERVQILGRPAQQPASKHPLYPIIHTSPNPTLTSKSAFGLISADLHLWGNSYWYVERGSNTGRIVRLWRLLPHQVTIAQAADKSLSYEVRDDAGRKETFLADEILHIRGLGYDGIQGYSPIALHMQTLGWNMAAARYGAQFFKNASRPSGVLSLPNPVKPEVKQALADSLSKHGSETGKLAVIDGAATYTQLTMPNDEAQFIEVLQFQEEDIVGIMGVPQHKVQILRRSTFNNVEQEDINAVTDCLQPLSVEVEQWMNLQLLSDAPSSGIGGGTERDRYFCDVDLKGLMRGDTAAQTAHLMAMFDRGIYSGNQCSDYLGLSPFEGGDVRFINRAYGPIDQAADWAQVSQNNPPAEKKAAASAEREVWARTAMRPPFRDAVGRLVSKESKARAKMAPGIFAAALAGLGEALGVPADEAFAAGYLGGLAQRSAAWIPAGIDQTATDELERAIAALQERQS